MDKIRWGIIGTGNISHQFARGQMHHFPHKGNGYEYQAMADQPNSSGRRGAVVCDCCQILCTICQQFTRRLGRNTGRSRSHYSGATRVHPLSCQLPQQAQIINQPIIHLRCTQVKTVDRIQSQWNFFRDKFAAGGVSKFRAMAQA